MDFLTIVTPDGRTLRREIGPECVRIGRAADNELPLDDPNVSRNHARLSRRPDGFYLEDAGAKNGVFVNGTRVEGEARLFPGDRFRLGSTTLILNAADSGGVEFTDTPLHQGSGTMVLRAATVLGTPAPGVAPADGAAARAKPAGIGPQSAAAGRGAGVASWPAILAEANEQLVFHRPLPELLETIMDLARRAVPFERGLLMLLQGERLVPQVVRVPPDEAARPLAVSRTIADRVVRDKESVLTSDALHDDRFMRGESVEAQHLRSVMCVPLWNNREVIGLIYVDNRHRAGLFQEENLRILTHLANVAAVKIENARLFGQALAAERMERDLQRAAEIQRFLLPSAGPSIPGYRLHGRSLPCREVGGDTYDFLELPEGRWAVSLGDVAGKGLPAALVMCSLQAALRALAGLALPATEIGARLNRLLCRQIPENRFVTLFFAILDPAAHRLEYFNAGHNPPCLLRRDGPPERLPVTGPPLGMFEEAAIGVRRVELRPGDLLICYSDGVTEETGGGEKEFGEERLFEVAREGLAEGPEAAAERIAGALGDHLGGASRQDDTTLVLLQRIG
jgi:serine phosphatase RsbU (regulator of sigma subunit)